MSEDTTTESTEPVADEAPASVVEETPEEVDAEPVEDQSPRMEEENASTIGGETVPVHKEVVVQAISEGIADEWLTEVASAVEARLSDLQKVLYISCAYCGLDLEDTHEHSYLVAENNVPWKITVTAERE